MNNNLLHAADSEADKTPLDDLLAALQRLYAIDYADIEAMLRSTLDLAAYLTGKTQERLEESDGYLLLPPQPKIDVMASALIRSGLLFGILLERHHFTSKKKDQKRDNKQWQK